MLSSIGCGEFSAATDGRRFEAGDVSAHTDCPHSLAVIRPKKKHKQMHKVQESLKRRRLDSCLRCRTGHPCRGMVAGKIPLCWPKANNDFSASKVCL